MIPPTMETSLFESYTQDFHQLLNKLTSQIEVEATGLSGEPLKALVRRTEAELEEAEEIVRVCVFKMPDGTGLMPFLPSFRLDLSNGGRASFHPSVHPVKVLFGFQTVQVST